MSIQKIGWRNVKYHWEIYLFLLPAAILVGLFQYIPAANGIYHSFYRWNGGDVSEYVGLKNFTDLLAAPDFWQSFHVAFIIGLWNVFKMVPAIAVAIWIHRCRSEKVQYLYRLLFVIPMVVPGLVIALIWRSFFFESTQGYLNQFLDWTGLIKVLCSLDSYFHWGGIFSPNTQPAWLGDPHLIIVSCIIWGFPWVGSFAVLTHLAKLQNIPKEIYEAAEIDGVSWWTKFTQIEAPFIVSSIYLMLVFVIIGSLKDAGMIIALCGDMYGGPGGAATVPALFMLRKAFISQDMGAACAVGIILTVIVMAMQKVSSLLLEDNPKTWWFRKWAPTAALFIGIAIVVFGGWWELAFLFILGGIPYGLIGNFLQRLILRLKPESAVRPSQARLEGLTPVQKAGSWSLRAFRHAAIWAVLLSAFLPVFLTVIVSLKNNQQYYEAPGRLTTPMHWDNWSHAWNLISPNIANSVFISTFSTVLSMLLALAAAYFFARLKVPLAGFFWNAILLLLMMPAVANLVPLFRLLGDLNLLNTLSALILVGASGGQIFCVFVLRNFVEEIPFDLFEAAEIDGANHFQQMWIIVMPLCGPILGTLGVMQFITEWNEFVLPLIVMRDHNTLPVMVALQRLAGEYIIFYGPLMSGYAIASIPIIVLFMFSMKLFVRGMTEGGTKG